MQIPLGKAPNIADSATQAISGQQKTSIEQLGQRVKAKYSQYSDMSDADVGELTLKKYPQYQSLVTQAQPEAPKGPTGILGFLSGAAKTIADAPRQFAESGASIGRAISESPVGQFVQNTITKPIVGMLPGQTQQRIGEAANNAKKVQEQSVVQPEFIKRNTEAEKAGQTAADIGMFFLPGGAAAKGARALEETALLSKLGRFAKPAASAITEGISNAAITAGQTGDIGAAAGAGALGAGITGLVGAAAPVISKLTKGTNLKLPGAIDEAVTSAASRTGVELPASSVTSNKLVKLAEQNAAQGIFGSKYATKVNAAVQRINSAAQELVAKTGNVLLPSEVGTTLAQKLDDFKQTFIKEKNALYDAIELPASPPKSTGIAPRVEMPNTGVVEAPKTLKFAQDILGGKEKAASVLGTSKDLQYFRNISDSLKNGRIGFQEMRAAIKELNERLISSTDPVVTGNRAALERLASTMTEEFETSLKKVNPSAATALDTANEAYKKGLNVLQSPSSKAISSNLRRPDAIFKKITSPATSVETLKEIMTLAGDKVDDIRASVIDHIITKASRDGEVRGTILETALRNFGPEKLKALFTPEQISVLTDISTVSKALAEGQRIAEGSQTAFSQKLWAMVGGAFFSPLLALKVIAGDAVLGKLLLSEKGQKAIINGIDLTKIGEGISGITSSAAPVLGRLGAGSATEQFNRQKRP